MFISISSLDIFVACQWRRASRAADVARLGFFAFALYASLSTSLHLNQAVMALAYHVTHRRDGPGNRLIHFEELTEQQLDLYNDIVSAIQSDTRVPKPPGDEDIDSADFFVSNVRQFARGFVALRSRWDA